MKKLLVSFVLTLGVAVPSVAMATTAAGATEGGDGSWCCPCCCPGG